MLSGYCFNGSVNAITILENISVVGGNFNFIHFQQDGEMFNFPFDIKKYGSVLSLENNGVNIIYVGFEKGKIMILSFINKNVNLINEIDSNQYNVECLHYFKELALLFSGSNKNRDIQIWSKEGKYILSMGEEDYETFPTIFCSSSVSKKLYSGNKGGSITVWDIEKFKYLNFMEGDGDNIIGLEIFKNNLISCTDRGLIKIRDESNLYTKIKIETLFRFSSLTILNDTICAGTSAGIIKFYDMEGRHFKDKVVHDGKILVMKSFKDQIYSGSMDGSFKII
jgi:WD40 repeat protein